MDAFLVRHGELVGVALAASITLAVLGLWVLSRVRARAAHVLATFGPRDRLHADGVGKTVVLEGVLREGTHVDRFAGAGGDDVLATSVRVSTSVSSGEGALVARRGGNLGLDVDGRRVRVIGEVEVLASPSPEAIRGAAAEALAPGEGAALSLEEHALVRGARVVIKARLERDDANYRDGGYVLVASREAAPRLIAARPTGAALARGSAAVILVTLPLVLGAGQVLSLSLANRVRARERDLPPRNAPANELPLTWTHRLALLGHRPVDALEVFDRLLARDHTSPELLAMAADAHARRGDCARAIEVFASHGAYERGRAYADRCEPGPAGLVALAQLERADGRVEEALAWLERDPDGALSVTHDRENTWVGPSFRALLLIEAGRYQDAAREIETRRSGPGPRPRASVASGLECLRAALSITAGASTSMPSSGTRACTTLRLELEAALPPGGWNQEVGDLRWIAAAAAHATRDEPWTIATLGPPSSWMGVHAVLHGEWPRWDGVVSSALEAARASEGPAVDAPRCQLELAEAVHRYARTGEMTPASPLCAERGDDRRSLVALDSGGPAATYGSAERYVAFRDTPSLETLRGIERWRPGQVVYDGERELCAASCVQSSEPDELDRPETALDRAAIAGDGRALHALLGPGLALRLARRHQDEVTVWYAHRLRPLGGPRARLLRLRDAAYTDLFVARRAGNEASARAIEARLDRFDAVLRDRRRVVLLEAFWMAIEPGP